jgi:hypothetical protein
MPFPFCGVREVRCDTSHGVQCKLVSLCQLQAWIAFSLTYTVAGFLARDRMATACSGAWVNEAINCLTSGTPRPVTRS